MASALLTALALAACSSKTDSDSSDSAETATSSPCQLQQAIPLGDSFDLVLSGLHLVDVKTDQDPTFPNPALYHRSTDTLDLDGFEVLSQNALTMVLGATLSIHGSNDPDAQVGFVPNTATVFDGWGYQRFEQGALTYWSQQSRGTPGGKPAVAEVKATIANQQLTAIRMIVPVSRRNADGTLTFTGRQQQLCVTSAKAAPAATEKTPPVSDLPKSAPMVKNPLVTMAQSFVPVDDSDLVPTLFDEFDSPNLDRTKWDTDYFGVDTSAGVSIANGAVHLLITESGPNTPWGKKAHIGTESTFKQQYGRFEVRAQFGTSAGYAPAFWLLPVDGGASAQQSEANEIDVFEHPGSNPFDMLFTVFSGPQNSMWSESTRVSFPGKNLTAGFHSFALDWTPTHITWLVDGKIVAQSAFAPHSPFFILVDNQTSGEWNHNVEPTFPEDYVIDFVHVFQHRKLGG